MIETSLNVALGARSYEVGVGRDLATVIADKVASERRAGRRLAVITDAAVAKAQKVFLEKAFPDLPVHSVPAGETSKAFTQLEAACEFLASHQLDRHSRLFAFGGGVVGDLAGFVAASYYRGIGFYQVPTTLLAMVDSSVGGKTGINLQQGKNLVGAFHQPLGVFADVDTLRTLPDREFSAGMAEVIKHALLGDLELFESLESGDRLTPASPDLSAVVARNCALKARVVAADEEERAASGGRALLNLGHTFGHAIEAVAGYGALLHGEAVAVGLYLAARLSEELGFLPKGSAGRVSKVLATYALPTALPSPLPLTDLTKAMARDKKARHGALRFVGLHRFGEAAVLEAVPAALVENLFREVGARA
jgi:3-dehydroquinate synthase